MGSRVWVEKEQRKEEDESLKEEKKGGIYCRFGSLKKYLDIFTSKH